MPRPGRRGGPPCRSAATGAVVGVMLCDGCLGRGGRGLVVRDGPAVRAWPRQRVHVVVAPAAPALLLLLLGGGCVAHREGEARWDSMAEGMKVTAADINGNGVRDKTKDRTRPLSVRLSFAVPAWHSSSIVQTTLVRIASALSVVVVMASRLPSPAAHLPHAPPLTRPTSHSTGRAHKGT